MTLNRLTLARLGSARTLTCAEPEGPWAEIGMMRSRVPV